MLFKDEIRTGARNLWLIATALVVFSAVIAAAEYFGRQTRDVEQLTWRDSVTVGLAQCLALVPGVSRSGATISAGFSGLDRELAAGSASCWPSLRCSRRACSRCPTRSIPSVKG